MYTYLIDSIVSGDIEATLDLMKKYRITMEYFKENMTDLVDEKLKLQFDKVGTNNKSNLTRAYNKNFKSSIIRTKNKKGKGKSSVNLNTSQNIYDENGNPLNEIMEEENEENDESSESVLNVKTKTKGKSKSRSKSNEDKSKGKSKSKSKVKNGKAKGKKKTKKKKYEDEEDEYDFEDDED